jgi:hypothetical protein
MLLKEKEHRSMDLHDHRDLKLASRKCVDNLFHLAENEPAQMTGRIHGVIPTDQTQAMANTLRRMILDFAKTICCFESS